MRDLRCDLLAHVGRLESRAASVRAIGRQGALERRQGVLRAGQGDAGGDAASARRAANSRLHAAFASRSMRGVEAAQRGGFASSRVRVPVQVAEISEAPCCRCGWSASRETAASRGPKQFVDFQNDVSAADILLAAREGFESVEHVKRYTAMGFGTDQGKLGNINGMAILAQALGKTIPETGTTTFRPNYTPVTFGTFAGRELGEFLDPIRKTAVHEWHVENGAAFEDVGNWKRPWYYPKNGEDMHAAVARESPRGAQRASAFSMPRRSARSTFRAPTPRSCSTGSTRTRGASWKSASAAMA